MKNEGKGENLPSENIKYKSTIFYLNGEIIPPPPKKKKKKKERERERRTTILGGKICV